MNIGVRAFAPFLFGLVLLILPLSVHAFGKAADAMCNPVTPVCSCGQIMGPNGCQGGPNKFMCPCQDSDSPVAGICTAAMHCSGKTAGGQGVDSGLSQLGQMLGQLMQQLMKSAGGSGSGAGAGTTPYTPPPATGCQGSYFQTSDVSQLTNPCAQYVAPPTPMGTTTDSSSCDALSQALGMCGTPSTDTVVSNNTNTNVNQGTSISSVIVASSTLNLAFGSTSVMLPGTKGPTGDIVLMGNGATIYGTSQDVTNNVGFAGFFGSDSFNGQQPQGLAARMCQSRPWSGGFWSAIMPGSFFDGLCSWRGYQVGMPPPPPAPVVELQQSVPAPKPAAPTVSATTTPSVPPRVQIWAVPASVPLGARTSVFWSTQGVHDCTETSPDGSFSQNSLSGGASTVPLTGATTFSISCTDTGGNPVTGYVTVNLSI